MQNFRNIKTWQKSYDLSLTIYKVTKKFPKEEFFALTNQIRRAAISIPANIAEGSAKESKQDFSRFLQISLGSACELESHLLISKGLGYLDDEISLKIYNDLIEVKKMLIVYISKIKSS